MPKKSLGPGQARADEDWVCFRLIADIVRSITAVNNLPFVQLPELAVNGSLLSPDAVVCWFKARIGSFSEDLHNFLNSSDVILVLVVV